MAPWSSLRGLGAQYLTDPRLRMLLDRYATYSGSDPRRAPAVLATVPRERLAYVHVAGGVRREGLYHDTHAHPLPEGPLDLLASLAGRLGPVPVMLERDDRFPAPEELARELESIRTALTVGASRWREARS